MRYNGIEMKNVSKRKMIYIDDSGDLGVKRKSSKNFVLGMIVFPNEKEAEQAAAVISKYRKNLGWTDCREFDCRDF